jgi:hypothetical protein
LAVVPSSGEYIIAPIGVCDEWEQKLEIFGQYVIRSYNYVSIFIALYFNTSAMIDIEPGSLANYLKMGI